MLQIEIWHGILLLLAFFGCVAAFGKLLLRQIVDQINRIENAHNVRITRLEDRLSQLEISIARDYVGREDWIRFGGVIDAKLDQLRSLVVDIQLRS